MFECRDFFNTLFTETDFMTYLLKRRKTRQVLLFSYGDERLFLKSVSVERSGK
jgi:hypothetical protein